MFRLTEFDGTAMYHNDFDKSYLCSFNEITLPPCYFVKLIDFKTNWFQRCTWW